MHWRYYETTWGVWLRGSWLSLGNADHSAPWTLDVSWHLHEPDDGEANCTREGGCSRNFPRWKDLVLEKLSVLWETVRALLNHQKGKFIPFNVYPSVFYWQSLSSCREAEDHFYMVQFHLYRASDGRWI